MKSPTESDLIRQCLEYLALKQIWAFRVNTSGIKRTDKTGREFWTFKGMAGCSDILGICGRPNNLAYGRFLAIETKMPGKKPTATQRLFLETVNSLGGLGLLVYDVRDLEAALRKEGY